MADAPLDYQTNMPAPTATMSRKRRIAEISIVIAILILLISILIPTLDRARRKGSQVPCASNLRQIGQGILLYCTDDDGHYPPDLETVLRTQQMSGEQFVCPSSSDTPATSATQLSQPGRCSYIYVGSHLTLASSPDSIVAFDDPANHVLEGAHVLYADGHVDWIDMAFVTILGDLAAGRNPPTTKSTMTLQMAKQNYKKNWESRISALKTTGWRIPAQPIEQATQPSQSAP